ncbi:MAG: hypothetical protein U0931_40095 [Vulcanimicrobiota bacterium]
MSVMVYDAADQLRGVQSPDATKLRYALDSLGWVAAITSANGNLSDVNAMVVSGAKNILFWNPEAEEIAPHDPNQWASPAVALKPRYWTPATTTGTRATESTGNSYFPEQFAEPVGTKGRRPVRAAAIRPAFGAQGGQLQQRHHRAPGVSASAAQGLP